MNLGLKNCERCGKVFAGPNSICKECIQTEEELFEIVHHYIRDNLNATLVEVSEATGVPEDIIIRFINQGKIKSKNISTQYETTKGKCAKCGVEILHGIYCNICMNEIKKHTNQTLSNLNNKQIIKNSVHSFNPEKDR